MRYLLLVSVLAFSGCMWPFVKRPHFYKSDGNLYIECATGNIHAIAQFYSIGCRAMGSEPRKDVVRLLKKRGFIFAGDANGNG